jgi:multiple sugar transport system ATP-binding protein
MTLGHRVAVMRDGLIQQIDTPARLFNRPANLFVAGFIGSPAMNFVRARIADGRVVFGEHALPLPARPELAALGGRELVLGIRPNTFEDDAFASPALPRLRVRAEVVEELGTDAMVVFGVAAPAVEEVRRLPEAGEDEEARLVRDENVVFTARVDPRTRIRSGEQVLLAVDPDRFHFFDPQTGGAVAEGSEVGAALAPASEGPVASGAGA